MSQVAFSGGSITHNDVKAAVNSYVASKNYLKKIIPLSVINIVYNRTDIDRSGFESKRIKTFDFVTVKSRMNKTLVNLHKWLKSAMQALERSYLKELYVFILDGGTDEVLEMYKYKVDYSKEKDTEAPQSEEVFNYTVNLFNNIKALADFKKLPANVEFRLEITYHDDTPNDYAPPQFEEIDNPLIEKWATSSSYTKLAQIKTGYHRVRCFGKGNELRINEVTPSQVTNVAEKDVEEVKSAGSVITLSEDDEEEIRLAISPEIPPTPNFKCACTLNIMLESIDMLECTVCKSRHHYPCCLYVFKEQLPAKFICPNCSESHPLKTMQKDTAQIVVVFQLLSVYAYNTGKIPEENWLAPLPYTTQYDVWSKIEKYVFDKNESNEKKLKSKEDLKKNLEQLLKALKMSDSMQLEENSNMLNTNCSEVINVTQVDSMRLEETNRRSVKRKRC